MSTATTTPPISSTETTRPFRRVLAVLAPLPWLALALANAITPATLGGSAQEELTSFAAHGTAASWAVALSAVFGLTLVPSALAMLVAVRPRARRGATIVTGYWVVAACFGAAVPAPQLITWLTAHYHLDQAAGIALSKALESSPLYAAMILPFALAITLGRIALGVVLWRARIAPRWMAVCLLLAVPVEWAGVATVGNAGPALAYVLTAIGFASASVALLGGHSNGGADR